MKNIIAIAAIVASSASFAYMDNNHSGAEGGMANSIENKTTGNAEARGTANFTMSFSGSGKAIGDFLSDTFGQQAADGAVASEDK